MSPRLLLGGCVFVAVACSPASPDPWQGFSEAQLCGTAQASLDLSPPPLDVRTSGNPLALPKSVRASGAHLSGAWSDFLDDTKLPEEPKADGSSASAGGSFVVRFLDAAALTEAEGRCHRPLPKSDDAYALVVGDGGISLAGSPRGQARALSTLTELVQTGHLARANIFDAPKVQTRTVMEGFYGLPWNQDGRLAAIRRAAALRFNSYARAPKGDYLSTFLWFQPYSDAEVADAAALAAYAKARGIDFCWELLPGGNVTYSGEGDRAKLEAKYDVLYGAGVRCFILAFDDTTKTLSSADQATGEPQPVLQAAFIRAVAAHLAAEPEPVSLAVVPNDYSTQMMQQDPSYIAELAKLPASISLGWTGSEVVSATITAADVTVATGLLGRAPSLVDNYPVSDNGTQTGALKMLPIDGRDPALFSGLQAYGGNAMVLPRASFVALASLAELAWNPAAYDPQRALERGVEVAAHGPNEALALLAAQTEGLDVGPNASAPALRAAIASYQAEAPGGREALVALLTKLRDLDLGLATADPALAAELAPWTAKARLWSQLCLDLVAAGDQYPPHAAPAEVVTGFQTRLDAAEKNQAVFADAAFDAFAKASLDSLRAQ